MLVSYKQLRRMANGISHRHIITRNQYKSTLAALQSIETNGDFTDDLNMSTTVSVEAVREFRTKHQINMIITGPSSGGSSNTTDEKYVPMTSFESTPFSAQVKRVLSEEGYTSPTPTQAQSWPISLQRRDLISVARTGSGKTCGFLLPAFHHMSIANAEEAGAGPNASEHSNMSPYRRQSRPRSLPRLLILAPTRELSMQIKAQADKFSKACKVTSVCLYGGVSREPQIAALKAGVDVVVATPGRANDLLAAGYLDLSKVSHFVLDEADRMLDMGFEPQIRQIAESLPDDSNNGRPHTQLFTATWPRTVQALAQTFVKSPVLLQIGDTNQLNANKAITQKLRLVRPLDKEESLFQLLEEVNPDPQKRPRMAPKTIIFRGRKHECDSLSGVLTQQGYAADSLHGDKTQGTRDRVMARFREGQIRVLVATDVAARGLDVKDIGMVVNMDFPESGVEDYVHRIGRTGRGEASGLAVTFVTPADVRSVHMPDLLALLRRCDQEVPEEIESMVPPKPDPVRVRSGQRPGQTRPQYGQPYGQRQGPRSGSGTFNRSQNGDRYNSRPPREGYGGRGWDRDSDGSDGSGYGQGQRTSRGYSGREPSNDDDWSR